MITLDNFMIEKGKYFANMKGVDTNTQLIKVLFEVAELAEAVNKNDHNNIMNEGFDVIQSVVTLLSTVDKNLIPGSMDIYFENWKEKIEGYITEGGKYNNK